MSSVFFLFYCLLQKTEGIGVTYVSEVEYRTMRVKLHSLFRGPYNLMVLAGVLFEYKRPMA